MGRFHDTVGSSLGTGKKQNQNKQKPTLPKSIPYSHQSSLLELLSVPEKRPVVPSWVCVAEMLVFSEAASIRHWLASP